MLAVVICAHCILLQAQIVVFDIHLASKSYLSDTCPRLTGGASIARVGDRRRGEADGFQALQAQE